MGNRQTAHATVMGLKNRSHRESCEQCFNAASRGRRATKNYRAAGSPSGQEPFAGSDSAATVGTLAAQARQVRELGFKRLRRHSVVSCLISPASVLR